MRIILSATLFLSFPTVALASPNGQQAVELFADEACPDCEIVLEQVVTLGDSRGDGTLLGGRAAIRVTQDRRGRYYVTMGDSHHFWVFSSTGESPQQIEQVENLQGDFLSTTSVLLGSGDSLYVFHDRPGRMTVLSPDFALARSVSLGFKIFKGFQLGAHLLINAGIRVPDRVGYPLHLIDSEGRFIRSFGSTNEGLYRPDLRDIIERRPMAITDDENGAWVGWLNQYVIEQWDSSGNLLRVLAREVDWFPPWWRPETGADLPPSPHMRDLVQDGNILWVLISVPGRNWKLATRDDAGRFTITDDNVYRNAMIEALDLRTGQVLATTHVPRSFTGFVGPGRVYGREVDPNGNTVVSVWDLKIQDSKRR